MGKHHEAWYHHQPRYQTEWDFTHINLNIKTPCVMLLKQLWPVKGWTLQTERDSSLVVTGVSMGTLGLSAPFFFYIRASLNFRNLWNYSSSSVEQGSSCTASFLNGRYLPLHTGNTQKKPAVLLWPSHSAITIWPLFKSLISLRKTHQPTQQTVNLLPNISHPFTGITGTR